MLGNPTGGAVVAGSATIGSAGSTLTINQSTQNAIINWRQFSIASGELTKFLVPNSSSATLNRVLGGNPSAIYGTLQSNGILYLVNPSGIVVGPSGRIDTAGFLASTLDISNEQFLAGGDLNFAGRSNASIDNEGTIHASSGDVYLIANQVNNNGTLSAPQGRVGLAAGSNVLYQPVGALHLFIQSNPFGTTQAVGITNSGTVQAAAAELKAAGGNAYALAINNSGVIAATGYKKVDGHVFLLADGGNITNSGQISARTASGNGSTIVVDGGGPSSPVATVVNSGTLDASATVAGGHGGSVTLKNTGGTMIHSGKILAQGGQDGAGGNVDVSGISVQFTGSVDATAPGGQTGTLRIDLATFTVAPTGGDETGAAVAASLGANNVILTAGNTLTINDAITWTTTNSLTLSTGTTGGTILINAPISGVNGSLVINTTGSTDQITTGAGGSVRVGSFILQNGTWSQIVGRNGLTALPAFTASQDFELEGDSTFERFAGTDPANGNAYEIADVYGLQGLASPSGTLLNASAELANDIDATATTPWNNGAGFVPIGNGASNFLGTFNGQGHTVNGLYVNTPSASYVGLFGEIGGGALVENVGMTNVRISGNFEVGGLVGGIFGTVRNSYTTGTVTAGSGGSVVGGLVGGSSGTINNSYSMAAVSGNSEVGGLVGANGGGTINDSYSTGAVSGNSEVGGLVGAGGTINGSFWDTLTSGTAISAGGTGATTTQLESQSFILGIAPTWDFTNVWSTYGGTLTPQLIGLATTGLPSGSGGSGGSTPPSTGGGDFGSNIVPPVLTTQQTLPELFLSWNWTLGSTLPPPPFNFTGNGTSDATGQQDGGLANSSGNSGQVGSGDAVQINNGGVNNVTNPQAAGALNQALSPGVQQNLANALNWANLTAVDAPGAGRDTAAGGGAQETILTGGDVAEIGNKEGVKKIAPDQAPPQLQIAMNGGVLNGTPSGAGH